MSPGTYVFDSLRTKHSYHEPMEFKRIAAIMLELSGKDLHTVLTLNFLKIVGRITEQMMNKPA